MAAKLRPLQKYNKKNALLFNNFFDYRPGSGKIIANINALKTDLSGVYIAKSKRQFLNAQKSDKALIYYRPKGLLYFNHNGAKKNLGSGGVIAKFNKKVKLSASDFKFKGSSSKLSYSLLPSSTSVKESHTWQIGIKYSNVKPGTRLYSSISGINAADISGGLNTSFRANKNGKNRFTFRAIADQLTEGTESFVYKLYSDKKRKSLVAKTEKITIQDTSKTPLKSPYSIFISPSNVEEGESVRVSIGTENVKPGTRLYSEIEGISSSDIDAPLQSSLTATSNGSTSVSIGTIADRLTEGDESFVYKLYSDSQRKTLIATSKPITIQDTSNNSQISSIFKTGSTSGELLASEEFDYLSFSADANSLVSFSLSTNSNDLYPQLSIVDKNGNQVAENNAYNHSSASIGLTPLNTGGNFYLKISSQVTGRSGSYSVTSQLTNVDQIKEDVIRLSNIEREKSGLSPLKYDPLLEKAAQSHVEDMDASGRYLKHTGSDGSSPEDRIKSTGYQAAWHDLGNGSWRYVSQENAAAGQNSAAEVVDAWMNSDGHRAAIMDPHAEEIGVGFEIDNVSGRTYWIQTFGIPWSPGDNRYF